MLELIINPCMFATFRISLHLEIASDHTDGISYSYAFRALCQKKRKPVSYETIR